VLIMLILFMQSLLAAWKSSVFQGESLAARAVDGHPLVACFWMGLCLALLWSACVSHHYSKSLR
jgi:cytochrome c biogenesis protein CcdA